MNANDPAEMNRLFIANLPIFLLNMSPDDLPAVYDIYQYCNIFKVLSIHKIKITINPTDESQPEILHSRATSKSAVYRKTSAKYL